MEGVVKERIGRAWPQVDQRWDAVAAFGRTLSERSPRYRPYMGVTDPARWQDGSRVELNFNKSVGDPSMSPLPDRHAGEDTRRKQLVQLCSYAIYHATFVHTWVNDRQFDDLGDPRFASLGLMTHRAPPKNGDMHTWEKRAQPLLRDAGFTMTLARILSHLDVGYLLDDGTTIPRHGDHECRGHRKSKTNYTHPELKTAVVASRAQYEPGPRDRLGDDRSQLDRTLICNLRSHINT